jgi:hypothetical protein
MEELLKEKIVIERRQNLMFRSLLDETQLLNKIDDQSNGEIIFSLKDFMFSLDEMLDHLLISLYFKCVILSRNLHLKKEVQSINED